MSVFRKLSILALLLPFFAVACSEKTERVCENEGESKCVLMADNQKTDLVYHVCTDGDWVKTTCKTSDICLQSGCVPIVEACSNHRFDAGEDAVDCGGVCASCVKCSVDADCGANGFCDSALGYVCSKRCRTNADCNNNNLWDGEFCRNDGRCSSKVFKTEWILGNTKTVVLPFDPEHFNAKCDFQVLWGDEPAGTDATKLARITDCANIGNRTHKYAESGKYNVKIIGTYDGWGVKFAKGQELPVASALESLDAVLSFGPVGLSEGAFYGANQLSVMPEKDVPDASKLRSLANCFAKTYFFNASIAHWDTSQVTNMRAMFFDSSMFNESIAHWNTSRVTDMSEMFNMARVFNQPIGDWDTSKVTDMSKMFSKNEVFNQSLNDWDTSSVTDMREMFNMARAFNQALNDWDTSKVTNMSEMFNSATHFEQPLNKWNTSSVTDMSQMFSSASLFNDSIGNWDTSSVSSMEKMFDKALHFNQNLTFWVLKSAVNLAGIFNLSAMNEANLCGLKAKGGEWETQWSRVGSSVTCK